MAFRGEKLQNNGLYWVNKLVKKTRDLGVPAAVFNEDSPAPLDVAYLSAAVMSPLVCAKLRPVTPKMSDTLN